MYKLLISRSNGVSARHKIKFGSITAFPNGSVDCSSVQGVDCDLRAKPFFAEGSTISIREFVVGALHNEMGMEASSDPDLTAASGGGRVITPSGMVLDGSKDKVSKPRHLTIGTGMRWILRSRTTLSSTY